MVVVYDDPDIGFIIARTMERMGCEVESVSYRTDNLTGLRERGSRLAVLEVKRVDLIAPTREEDSTGLVKSRRG